PSGPPRRSPLWRSRARPEDAGDDRRGDRAGLGRARGDRGESPDGEPGDRARRGACRARAAAAADDARREPGGRGLRERCACDRHRRGAERRGRDATCRSRRARCRRRGRSASPDGPVWLLVKPSMPGIRVGPSVPTLGLRGLDACRIRFTSVRIPSRNRLAGAIGPELLALARLGVAATGVGLAQAALESALRYAQQRTTFGKPIAQHQAIQLALAGMATKTTAARLLAYDAAAALDDAKLLSAKGYASEVAYEVALDSMRVHGGYGYTSEFPVERYYRDAAHLASSPTTNAADRVELASRLSARGDA